MRQTLASAAGLALTVLCGCATRTLQQNTPLEQTIEYARYFSISSADSTIKTITVTDPLSERERKKNYTLVPKEIYNKYKSDPYAIPYPIERCICMSTSHVAFLNSLSQTEKIKGISETRFLYNPDVRALIERGEIKDVGSENLLNFELVMSLRPDLLFAYEISGADNSYIEKLHELGIKVIVVADYLENHPLGRMEYIKLFGELTGRRGRADSIFNHVKRKYLAIKEEMHEKLRGHAAKKILINSPFNGIWYIPGGENYMSLLIKDAGGHILGSREGEVESERMSLEKGYMYALEADIWLDPGEYTLKGLSELYPLFSKIPALKRGLVYNNSKRHTSAGGSDFWESGVVEPHIVLRDLSIILHPELYNENDTLKYHYRLL